MNFFKRYQKILLVVAFVIIVIILAVLIWRTFFKPLDTTTTPTTNTAVLPGGLPTAGEGNNQGQNTIDQQQLPGDNSQDNQQTPTDSLIDTSPDPVASGGLTKTKRLTDRAALGATISSDGQDVQYYDPETGLFYRLDSQGNIEVISDKVFHNVENISWSPDKEKAILEYPDGANIIYDFNTQTQVTLPKHWEDFGFSPQSDKIVAKSLGIDPESRYLVTANTDGSNAKAIEYIGNNADTVYTDWSPDNQVAAIYTQGLDFDRQEMYFIGFNNENFKSAIIEGRGFESQWSDNGDKLLYSVYSSKSNLMPELWIVNSQGDNIGTNRTNLNVQTWADKCNFSDNRYAYCAVPQNLPEGAGLFPDLALRTKDNLYRIDVQTGIKTLIAIPEGSYNISDLMLTNDNSNLYFTDQTTNEVYQIRLK